MQPLSVEIYCPELGGAATEVVQADVQSRLSGGIALTVEERAPDPAALSAALAQSWQFPEARQALEPCRFVLTLRETPVPGAPPAQRLRTLQAAVQTVLEAVHGEALHCIDSQQFIPPGLFVGETEARGIPTLQAGAINVRFFRIDTPGVADGRFLMDTLGLHALGLPDVQIDYRWLDPGAVARTLFGAAAYLFEFGDVIEEGHSIEGCLPGSRWSAKRMDSVAEPRRPVVAFDPGVPYSTRDEQ